MYAYDDVESKLPWMVLCGDVACGATAKQSDQVHEGGEKQIPVKKMKSE